MMSKEDLARFKSADAKLLALQHKKALLDKMAAELDEDHQVKQCSPKDSVTGIMERAVSLDKAWVQVQDS